MLKSSLPTYVFPARFTIRFHLERKRKILKKKRKINEELSLSFDFIYHFFGMDAAQFKEKTLKFDPPDPQSFCDPFLATMSPIQRNHQHGTSFVAMNWSYLLDCRQG